jgi:hypothetical protein
MNTGFPDFLNPVEKEKKLLIELQGEKMKRFKKNLFIIILFGCSYDSGSAQGNFRKAGLISRVRPAPESVFTMFRKAGMKPVNHKLTGSEKQKLEQALSVLPPLHQQILRKNLHSISFMDNMPNNGLTSPVVIERKLYNITLRAGILNETISEWATKKEKTSFNPAADSLTDVSVEAGNLDAIQYVLLHEATHVVDAVLNITPHPSVPDGVVEPTNFTRGIWRLMDKTVPEYADSVLKQASIRNRSVSVARAPELYKTLRKTPFVSLYGAAAWSEDVAEFLTIYHLTEIMRQPYRIIVKQAGKVVTTFEPMRNELVILRKKWMNVFYEGSE